MDSGKINRLIDIQRQQLDELVVDLNRLQQLLETHLELHQDALKEKNDFSQIFHRSLDQGGMGAAEMQEYRSFLGHLHDKCLETEQIVVQVTQQKDHAQMYLKQAYAEVKSLEVLKQRISEKERLDLSRRIYIQADEQSISKYREKT